MAASAASIEECLRHLVSFNDRLRFQQSALQDLQREMNVIMVHVRGQIDSDGAPGLHDSGQIRHPTTWSGRQMSDDFSDAPMDEAVERAISLHSMAVSQSFAGQEPGGLLKALSVASARAFGNVLRTSRTDRGPLSGRNSPDFAQRRPSTDRAHLLLNAGKMLDRLEKPLKESQSGQLSTYSLSSKSLPGANGRPEINNSTSPMQPDVENNISWRPGRSASHTRMDRKSKSAVFALRNRPPDAAAITEPVAPPALVVSPPVVKAPAPDLVPNGSPPELAGHNRAVSAYIRFGAVPRFNEFRVYLPAAEFDAGLKKVNIENPSLLLHPRSTFVVAWDILLSLILFSIAYLIPVGISFDSAQMRIESFAISLTAIFFLDAVFSLCQLTTKEGLPVPARLSMKRYLSRNGLFDLITILPFDRFVEQKSGASATDLVFILRLLRLRRMGPILMTNPVYGSISLRMQSTFGVGGSFMSVWLFGGLLIVYLHLYGCGVFLAGKLTDFQSWDGPETQSILKKEFGAQYTWAVFVAIGNTFPITGFRPITPYEQWSTIVTCLIGALLYASLVGSISSFSFGLDSSGRLYKQKMDEVNEYMSYKHLGPAMKNKVQQYFQLKYRGKYFDEAAIMAELNDSLRQEITIHNCRDLIAKVSFLSRNVGDGRDMTFLGRIAGALKAVFFIQGDTIFEQGWVGNEMFFILSGTVEILVGNGIRVGQLSDGAFFGEVAILAECPRTATIRATADTVAYQLSRKDLEAILADFEDMAVKIRLVYEERMAKVRKEKEMKEAAEKEAAQKALQEKMDRDIMGSSQMSPEDSV